MICYNDNLQLTQLYNTKKILEFIDFINDKIPSKNLVDLLHKLTDFKFINSESYIKLNAKERELIIYKENFLTNLPKTDETYNIKLENNVYVTLGYPGVFKDTKDIYFIKKINIDDTDVILNSPAEYSILPYDILSKCTSSIEKLKNKLNKINIFYINETHKSGFSYNLDSIIYVLYLSLVGDYKNLITEQLFLMENFNFSYTDFNILSNNEVRQYINSSTKILNERNNK